MLYKCEKCEESYYGIHICMAAYIKPKPIYIERALPFIGPGTRSVEEFYRHNRPMNDRERQIVDQVMDAHALWPQPLRMGG